MSTRNRSETGIDVRHAKGCASERGRRCDCEPSYRVRVWSNRDQKRIAKTFTGRGAHEAAKRWRADALVALSKGAIRPPTRTTLRDAWGTWYEGATAGVIRNRSGDRFKPSALRAYAGAMRRWVLPELGDIRLTELRRAELQGFANGLLSRGLSPSSVQGALLPVRAIIRHAISVEELAVNPCAGLQLPAVRSRRERYASPQEAEALIAAVPLEERATWATAMYAGLRLGELRALRACDVDLAAGVICVERGWDPAEGPIDLKSKAGRRKVPIAAILRDYLGEHLARTGPTGEELIFGPTAATPFTGNGLQRHADEAWGAAGLERLTPHDGRHTFASLMIAAGVNAKALSTFMGHANISITLDRYAHLMPGSDEEAAGLLDDYVTAQRERAEERARAAEPAGRGPIVDQ